MRIALPCSPPFSAPNPISETARAGKSPLARNFFRKNPNNKEERTRGGLAGIQAVLWVFIFPVHKERSPLPPVGFKEGVYVKVPFL